MKPTSLMYLAIVFACTELSFSQNANDNNSLPLSSKDLRNELIKSNKTPDLKSLKKSSLNDIVENLNFRYFAFEHKRSRQVKYSFNLMSSLESNISFGGFWDKYAVINFTPQMNIKPVKFINIYASHYLNYLIPVSGLKEYSQSLVLKSIGLLAFDNTLKILLNENGSWITDIICYSAKNILMDLLLNVSTGAKSSEQSPVLQLNNYYYSVSINF